MTRSDDSEQSSKRAAGYALALFWIIYVVHSVDRSIILILVEPIRHEFNLNDTEVGLVSGMVFAIAYVVCGIPLGFAGDRVRRIRLLAGLVILWSVFTFAGGLAGGLIALLLTRLLAGASESGASPVMLSMLSDLFKPRARPAVFAFFYTGPLVGAILGTMVGGHIAGSHGWRAALFLAGVPGILLAVLLLMSVKEPPRGHFDGGHTLRGVSMSTLLAEYRHRPALRYLLVSMVLFSLIFTSINAWFPVMLMRTFGFPIARAGWISALAVSLTGGLGSLTGGFIAQRIGRTLNKPVVLMCTGATLLALPAGLLALHLSDATTVIFLFAGWSFLSWLHLGPCYGLYANLSPPSMRAALIAVLTTGSAFTGIGVGPQLVGLFSDHFSSTYGPAKGLTYALTTIMAATLLPSLLLLRTAAKVDQPDAQGDGSR